MLNYNKLNKKAFTLIEMLLSLFVFSLIVHGIHTAFITYQTVDTTVRQDKQLDWYQFLVLLDNELKHYDVTSVSSKRINLTDPANNNKSFSILLDKGRIYKVPGFHPYLFDVKEWHIQLIDSVLYISILFNNDQLFEGQIVRNKVPEVP